MLDLNIVFPSKPRIILEEEFKGIYEIEGLYPGYGHTLGNSLRRIILSSLPGAAITSLRIAGVEHEFSTIKGIKEDIIQIILNLKKVRLKVFTDEPQQLELRVKGAKAVTAGDIKAPGQVNIMNPDFVICNVTDKNTELDIDMRVERGLGYISKEVLEKERVTVGSITLDAIFTPIRRVNYEVENMRVGTRTDFNRLRIFIETDGTFTPREALERSIEIMINQLKAIVGFEEPQVVEQPREEVTPPLEPQKESKEVDQEFLKTRIESLNLSQRTINALSNANVRTVGGLVRKKEDDILDIDGLGPRGLQEIKRVLGEYGITLK